MQVFFTSELVVAVPSWGTVIYWPFTLLLLALPELHALFQQKLVHVATLFQCYQELISFFVCGRAAGAVAILLKASIQVFEKNMVKLCGIFGRRKCLDESFINTGMMVLNVQI